MDGFLFWKNVDSVLKSEKLISVASKAGINYRTLKNQRSSVRLPNLEDAFRLSNALGVSLEYLLTGQDPYQLSAEAKAVNEDPELQAVVRAMARDRRLLHVISAVVESSERTMERRGV